MGQFANDLRLGVRLIRTQPVFSAMAIVTLAVGIGLTTTLFTVIHAAWVRPLPYPNPEQLVRAVVLVQQPGRDPMHMSPAVTDVRAWRTTGRVVTHGAIDRGVRRLIVDAGLPERVDVSTVSEGYFEMLGIRPLAGRVFVAEDVARSQPLVFVLGHQYWQSRLGGDPAALGRVIRVEGEAGEIVGILPNGIRPDVTVWRPFRSVPEHFRGSGASAILRLREGVSMADATPMLVSELTVAGNPAAGVDLESHYGETVSGAASTLKTLLGAVGAVLLLACINVAGLLMARGSTREAELAVRGALGASRARLVSQLLAESVVLAVAGGALGVFLAWVFLDAIVAILPLAIPETAVLAVNGVVLTSTLGVALLSVVVFGLLPAFRLSRVRLAAGMTGTSRGLGPALSRRTGQGLIAIEVALAVILIAGAGLMVRSFVRLGAVDLGFDPDSFLVMEVAPADTEPAIAGAYYPQVLDAIRALPEVQVAGAGNQLPIGGSRRAGSVMGPAGSWVRVDSRLITPGYFEALGLPVREGRLPVESDRTAGRPVAVLNASAARALFPDQSPIGRTFSGARLGWDTRDHEVIGVVADTLQDGARAPSRPNLYTLYRGVESLGSVELAIVVRPRGPSLNLAMRLRQMAESTGHKVVVDRIQSGRGFVAENVSTPRHRMQLLGLLGVVGLVLAVVGIFGVTAFAVGRRTREIGVRMALGAQPAIVVRGIIGDAAWPIVCGLLVGLGGAWFASRLVATFLFQTSPRDVLTFGGSAALLAIVALAAAWWPARRAARVDPVSALRGDA